MGPANDRVLVAAMITILFAAAFQYQPFGLGDDGASAQETRSGAIEVDSVTNNYAELLKIYVSPVEGDSLVDPFVPLLERGETAGPATLNCTSEWGEATDLRVVAYSTEDVEKIADRRADLRPGDCEAGGGTAFGVTVNASGTILLERTGSYRTS